MLSEKEKTGPVSEDTTPAGLAESYTRVQDYVISRKEAATRALTENDSETALARYTEAVDAIPNEFMDRLFQQARADCVHQLCELKTDCLLSAALMLNRLGRFKEAAEHCTRVPLSCREDSRVGY